MGEGPLYNSWVHGLECPETLRAPGCSIVGFESLSPRESALSYSKGTIDTLCALRLSKGTVP